MISTFFTYSFVFLLQEFRNEASPTHVAPEREENQERTPGAAEKTESLEKIEPDANPTASSKDLVILYALL